MFLKKTVNSKQRKSKIDEFILHNSALSQIHLLFLYVYYWTYKSQTISSMNNKQKLNRCIKLNICNLLVNCSIVKYN